jgi:hypothetical protein
MKKIVIMPGGFHPFHAGHLALYKSAVEAFPGADVYVAASDNQKERPFPFKVKEALATVAGIPKGKFVQVKSPFRPEEITKHYDSSEDALIFVRSDKDRREHPKPGGTKKDGSPAYYQAYNEKNLKPFAEEGYIAYLPTVPFAGGMTSATEIRKAWPRLDELGKIELIRSMYPDSELSVPKVKKLVQMLDAVLVGELTESNVVDMETPMKAEFINWLKTKNLPISDLQNRVKLRNLRLQYEKESGNKLKETFVDPSESEQYWNHDDQNVGVGMQIDMPLRDNDKRGRRQGYNESIDKIRGMIEESTDDQKSKSVHLHRKLFKLMEEEKKNNVVKLRGFGREVDKPIPDLNRVRAEKEKEQERENNYYSERRAEQEELLARLQAELLNAKQEFAELADAQLLPIEMLDTMESITKLIDYIENWEGSEAQNNFPFTESILEKLQLKTVQLKEYFGGMRDTSAPRVLRKQTPKLSPKAFWNTIDLSETADYIEEK